MKALLLLPVLLAAPAGCASQTPSPVPAPEISTISNPVLAQRAAAEHDFWFALNTSSWAGPDENETIHYGYSWCTNRDRTNWGPLDQRSRQEIMAEAGLYLCQPFGSHA